MKGVNEFLVSSTIHGLIYISTSKSTIIKVFWLVVVLFGFGASVFLIYESFVDWSEAPIGTSEETLPINEITFPKIIVCPPKGTHTALNHYLAMSKPIVLDKSERNELIESAEKLVKDRESWELMMDNLQYKEHNKFKNWYEGKSSVSFQTQHAQASPTLLDTLDFGNFLDPEWHYSHLFTSHTYATSGSVQSPWFGDSFDEETFIPSIRYM